MAWEMEASSVPQQLESETACANILTAVEIQEQAHAPFLGDLVASPTFLLTPSRKRSHNQELFPSARARGGATLAGSIFNLANTIMGSGLLTLPSAFASSGLVAGLLMAVVAAAFNIFTLHLLASMARSTHARARTHDEYARSPLCRHSLFSLLSLTSPAFESPAV